MPNTMVCKLHEITAFTLNMKKSTLLDHLFYTREYISSDLDLNSVCLNDW